jgi:hypothetical protein
MARALPPLIEVLAMSGQHRRAQALAANLTDVADRMLAFRALAMVNGSDGNLDAARGCAEEVEGALSAMHVDHLPMAWCWAAQAAMAAGLTERAKDCAKRAIGAVALGIDAAPSGTDAANDGWNRPNGLFWAAMASRTANYEDGRAQVRAALDEILAGIGWFRNQVLQAAAVSGCTEFLKAKVAEIVALGPEADTSVRIGNLALAVADAGLESDMVQLVASVGAGWPQGEPDSIKRWAWALALSGRHRAAVDALDHVHDPVELSKAIARIASIVAEGGDQALLERLSARITARLPADEPRARARLLRTMWTLGQREAALAQAEIAIADSGRFSAMVDPRAEGRGGPITVQDESGFKTARRAMVTSRAPIGDQTNCWEAENAAKRGDRVKAHEFAARIEVPLLKARALGAIAESEPDSVAGIEVWMEAMIFACRAGRGEVEHLLAVGIQLLQKAGRGEEAAALEGRISDVDAAWQLELFVDEYASLRTSMTSGGERTRILDGLMLAPIQLAKTRVWTQAEVRNAWERGEDGSRLFALGLMTGDPALVIADLLVEGIRGSRSAFEQYYALRAVVDAPLQAEKDNAVVRAIKDELNGLPRSDGSPARLGEGHSRRGLARRIIEQQEDNH